MCTFSMALQLSSLSFSVSLNELEFPDSLRKIQACKYCCSKKYVLHKSGVISEVLKFWFHPPKKINQITVPLTFQHKVKGKRQFLLVMGSNWKYIQTFSLLAGCHKDCINQKYEGRHTKGGLISERFSLCLQSPKKVPKHSPEYCPQKKKMLWDLAPFLGEWNQNGKLSEI